MYAAEPSGNESENLFVTIHYKKENCPRAVLFFVPFLAGKGGAPIFGHRLFLSLFDSLFNDTNL